MPNYVPLNKTAHREAGIRATGLGFASRQAAVPLVMDDVPRVLALMVVAFVRRPEGKGMELVALQSLEPNKNVYVHTNGRWITGYRPAWYRSHPFRLLPEANTQRQVLCVDEEAEAFVHEAGAEDQRLFEPSGEPTELTQKLLEFLTAVEKSRAITQAAVDELDRAGVIKPWPIQIRSPHGETGRDIGGVYQTDEKALRDLDAATLSGMAKTGALSLAYAQLFSQHRLPILSKLYDLRNEALLQEQDLDMNELFGERSDDFGFKFDA